MSEVRMVAHREAQDENRSGVFSQGIGQDLVVCMDSPGWGGSERDLVRILPLMSERLAAAICGEAVAPEVRDFLTRHAVQVTHCHAGNRLLDGVWGVRAGLRWSRQYPQGQFLVWAHHCDSNRWLQVALAWRKAKFVVAERLMPATRAEAFNSISRRGIKQWVGKRAHRVVLCGYSQIDNYSKWFGVPRARIDVVPNTRPIEAIAARVRSLRADPAGLRRELGLPKGKLIVNVGRLSPQKDQATLIEAVKILSARGHSVSAMLVGGGAEEHPLRQLANGLGNRVIFAGEQSDPLPWLAAADVFAFPSRSEGLPGALVEAMAAGLPCVGTNIPGNSELLLDEKTGLLVPPADRFALANAIARLLYESEYAGKLAMAGTEHVHAHYDMSIEVAAWRKIFGAGSLSDSGRSLAKTRSVAS